jgi:alpha-amylase
MLPVIALLVLAGCSPAPPVSPSPRPVQTDLALGDPTATLAPTSIPYTTPDWFRHAVVYQIFVRSFADSNQDGIGDLQGVIARLDYLQALGVDVIWLMPIYPSPSEHGYDVADYLGVSPDYGTRGDLRQLVDAMHARGLRLLLDFVPSHLSDENPLFAEALANPASPHSDWFAWTNDAHTEYASFADNAGMPRFNLYNPEVAEYLTQAALFWLDQGVDGFRIDNATFPPRKFLSAFRQRIKAADPDALLLGEAWVNDPSRLARFFPDQFDALFDFPLAQLALGYKDSIGDGLLNGEGVPALLGALLDEEAERFPAQAMAVRFLANHDTNRVASKVLEDPARARLAAAFLVALPGPILVYYGDEIGMLGTKGGPPSYDNYRREPMEWSADQSDPLQPTWFRPADRRNLAGDGISVEEQLGSEDSLLEFYRHALRTRAAHAAVLAGDGAVLTLDVSGPGPWGLVREADGERVIALFNFSTETRNATLPADVLTSGPVIDLLTGVAQPSVVSGEAYSMTLSPAQAVWLAHAP